MSDPSTQTTADLEARIRELEERNAELTARTRPSSGRWRAFLSAICIVLATILVPVSIASAWARVQLVDEDAFVATLAPLVDDPHVQAMIVEETMGAVNEQVDFYALTGDALDGVASLGLPPRAEQALQLLRAPVASGLEGLVENTVTTVVESDAFSDVWATTVRGAHRALTVASTSDGQGIVVLSGDGVGIQLRPIVEQVKQTLVDRGVGAASLIPSVDRVIIIGDGQALAVVRTSYAVALAVGWWLPIVSLALFALGIALARRRSAAVIGSGVGLALGSTPLAVSLGIGATIVGAAAGDLGLSPAALDVIYQQVVTDMMQTAWVLSLLGVVIAVIGWLMGRSRPAVALRSAVESGNAAARLSLARRGLDTGAAGSWLYRNRSLVRVIVAVVAVLWLFLLRPITVGDIALVLLVSLLVGWILTILERGPAEIAATEARTADEVAEDIAEAVSDELIVDEAVADEVATDVIVADQVAPGPLRRGRP